MSLMLSCSAIIILFLYSLTDFRKRFLSLLSYQFRTFTPSLALTLATSSHPPVINSLSLNALETIFSQYDLKRLELYSNNMADHHLITDLLPSCERPLYHSDTSLISSPFLSLPPSPFLSLPPSPSSLLLPPSLLPPPSLSQQWQDFTSLIIQFICHQLRMLVSSP